MSVERVGQFIEFTVAGEGGGTRTLARVNSIQLVSETDCIGDEVLVTIANRTFRVGTTLRRMREILVQDQSSAGKAT